MFSGMFSGNFSGIFSGKFSGTVELFLNKMIIENKIGMCIWISVWCYLLNQKLFCFKFLLNSFECDLMESSCFEMRLFYLSLLIISCCFCKVVIAIFEFLIFQFWSAAPFLKTFNQNKKICLEKLTSLIIATN